eukprot:241654_1
MSLFHAREYWSVRPEAEEEYDIGCLEVANIDNDPSENAKIIIGNFQGVLKVFLPRQSDYKIEDLLLEQNLGQPILQLGVGRFISNSLDLALAALHPRSIAVYSFTAVSSAGSEVSYYETTKAYEHKLKRTSANFTFGSFGGGEDKDMLCVQSVDGNLSFFDQDHFVFSRFLNGFLVPGPIVYCQKIDSFITVNAEMCIECYKFRVLSTSSELKTDVIDEMGSLTSSKKLQVGWSCNVGEPILQLSTGRFTSCMRRGDVEIIALGERHLFVLSETGSIRLQKRFDYNPSALCLYDNAARDRRGATNNIIIATHQQSLMIYQDTKLIWAARTQINPVALRVAKLMNIRGLVVCLDASGLLQVCYMGTDPTMPQSEAPEGEGKSLDYEEMDRSHRKLMREIRSTMGRAPTEPSDKLLISSLVSDLADARVQDAHTVTVTLSVSYSGAKGDAPLSGVMLCVETPDGIDANVNRISLDPICAEQESQVISIAFSASKTHIPSSLEIKFVAAYLVDGEPRSASHTLALPFALVARVIPPIKNPKYMVTSAWVRYAAQILCFRCLSSLQCFQLIKSYDHLSPLHYVSLSYPRV